MTKRFKLWLLSQRVKRLEKLYQSNPTLAHLHKWSDACGQLYRMKYPKPI